MTSYPKDVEYKRSLQREMSHGDSSNVSYFEMSSHGGTHIDAPLHYYPEGNSIDQIPLEILYGPAHVIDCRGHEAITADILTDKLPDNPERILLMTDNSNLLYDHPEGPFNAAFVYLADCGAQLLADLDIKLVGIDYLSIDRGYDKAKSSHHILLEKGITILESIILKDIKPGKYFLACGALKMTNSEGAPCRAVLIEQ